MTEYIFHPANSFGWKPGEYERENNMDHYGTLHDEIVRCRDCRSSEQKTHRLMCHHFSMSSGAGWPVEPDGFCAWACRKEQ